MYQESKRSKMMKSHHHPQDHQGTNVDIPQQEERKDLNPSLLHRNHHPSLLDRHHHRYHHHQTANHLVRGQIHLRDPVVVEVVASLLRHRPTPPVIAQVLHHFHRRRHRHHINSGVVLLFPRLHSHHRHQGKRAEAVGNKYINRNEEVVVSAADEQVGNNKKGGEDLLHHPHGHNVKTVSEVVKS